MVCIDCDEGNEKTIEKFVKLGDEYYKSDKFWSFRRR